MGKTKYIVALAIIMMFMGKAFAANAQSFSSVRSSLGVSLNKLSELSLSSTINKWSKYKPVSGIWPVATNGKYALDPFNNWTYTRPSDNFRLGDFRNYDANAKPPLYMDEDGSYEEADLYPLNTPDHSDWNFVVNTNPVTGELSCDDLGLSNNYIAFRVMVPGGTVYYKSYDKISTINSKIITISAGLNSHVLPYSFTNLPYGVGSFTLEFGFCTQQTTGWSTSNPGFYLLPVATSTVNCRNSFQFNVHDWIWLSGANMYWLSGDLSYEELHIATSLENWRIISKPAWVNISVYQGSSQIGNANLWATEMDIRVTPTDNNNTADRDGLIEIGTGLTVLASIGVSQAGSPQIPPYAYISTVGFQTSASAASVSLSSTTLTYSLTPMNVGINVFCSVQLEKNGNVIDTGTIFLKDNSSAGGSFTLSVPANYNDVYQVVISK